MMALGDLAVATVVVLSGGVEVSGSVDGSPRDIARGAGGD